MRTKDNKDSKEAITVNEFMEFHKVGVSTLAGLLGITPRTLYDFQLGKRKPTKTIQILLEKLNSEQDVVHVNKLRTELNAEIMAVIDKHFKAITLMEDPVIMKEKLEELIKYRDFFNRLN